MMQRRGDSDRPRVCLVTAEFAGKDPVSSVSLHYRALATLLAGAGHDVFVLYTGRFTVEEGRRCVRECEAEGICFVPLLEPNRHIAEYETTRFVHRVYQWLKIRDFHVVHFADRFAPGFYTLLAREQGLAFEDTLFTLLAFSGSRERRMLGERFLDSPNLLKTEHLETAVRDKVDYVLEPSHRSGSAYSPAGSSETRVIHLPHLVPELETVGPPTGPEESVVFLSDMDIAGGLEEMIETCLSLPDDASQGFVFLGANRRLPTYDSDAEGLLSSQLRGLPATFELDPSLADVVRVLQQPGTRVVVPGRHDTALWAVQICLDLGVPFTAYATPGARALVGDLDAGTLRDPDVRLGDLVRDCLEQPGRVLRPSHQPGEPARAWIDWHKRAGASRRPAAPALLPGDRLVSVCIATYERPELLERALRSLQQQDYERLELIIVDDGSTGEDARHYLESLDTARLRRTVQVLRIENSGPSAARNHGARHANGEHIMFMDDDNYALKHEVSTFLAVSTRVPADILTCTSYCSNLVDLERFDPWASDMILPVGNYPDLALFECCMGDTNMFLSPEAFFDLGGFPTGETDEDWDFLLHASLSGKSIEVIPEPLYIYYWHVNSNARLGNRYFREMRRVKRYREYAKRFPDLVEMAHGMARGRSIAVERKHVILPQRLDARTGDGFADQRIAFGKGFHNDEGEFRWASRTAEADVTDDIELLGVRIGNNALSKFDRKQTVRVYRNDRIETEVVLDNNQPVPLTLLALQKGDCITFVSDFEFCPGDWGAHDDRHLSFMLFHSV